MGAQDFVDGLRALGCEVTEVASPPGAVANYITMPLTISAGRFAGQTVILGFQKPAQWPATPPTGPHVSPRLMPIKPQGDWPNDGIHEGRLQPFANGNWQYWSRPCNGWADTDRSVKTYVNFLHQVFSAID